MNIGVLNSGGDSPGLNAVIEGVVGAASRRGWNVVGFYDGFEGLLSEEGDERFEWLTPAACRGLRAKGGTILGTVNKGNFAIKVGVDQKGAIEPAVLEKTKATVRRLGLDALIVVGGDGSQSTALLLSEIGLPVVGVPKTIDNDIYGTDVTFGFHTAVDIATDVIDRIHTTAGSHSRVMCIEIMGNKAGWLTLYSGIAGGADIILLPELPYDIKKVAAAVENRAKAGKNFSILAVAEGAFSTEEAKMKRKEWTAKRAEAGYTTATARIAKQIEEMTGAETRICVPGHMQRGGFVRAADAHARAAFLGARLGLDVEPGGLVVAVAGEGFGQAQHVVGNGLVHAGPPGSGGRFSGLPYPDEDVLCCRA